MALATKISGEIVRYLFAGAALANETAEELAAGGAALIRARVAAALEKAGTDLDAAGPGPEGVRDWLGGYLTSTASGVADALAACLPVPLTEAGLPGDCRAVADHLAETIDAGFLAPLQDFYAAMDKSAQRARQVDGLVQWIWDRGIAQTAVHPCLKEAGRRLQPHRLLLAVLGTDGEEARVRAAWRHSMNGLLDQVSRRLTSELTILWTRRVYASYDHSLPGRAGLRYAG